MRRERRKLNASSRKKSPRSRRKVESLRHYLKKLGRGEEGRAARIEFASRVGTSLPYLEHIVQGFRQASMELAIKIEQATYGIVRCEELHPEGDWAYLTQRKPALHSERAHA